jgi:hypothetical protein
MIKKIKYEQKLKRIEINLDKHTYDFIKNKKINASKLIRQLLRVALFNGSTDYTSYTNYTPECQTHNLGIESSNLSRGIFLIIIFLY